jgi:hypothetical protein
VEPSNSIQERERDNGKEEDDDGGMKLKEKWMNRKMKSVMLCGCWKINHTCTSNLRFIPLLFTLRFAFTLFIVLVTKLSKIIGNTFFLKYPLHFLFSYKIYKIPASSNLYASFLLKNHKYNFSSQDLNFLRQIGISIAIVFVYKY